MQTMEPLTTATATTDTGNGWMMQQNGADSESIWDRLRNEAEQIIRDEPELTILLKNTILSPGVQSFEDAVACTVCYRLLLQPCGTGRKQEMTAISAAVMAQQQPPSSSPTASLFCPHSLRDLIRTAMDDIETLEYGHTMRDAIRDDALAVCQRDPAMDTILEVVLFSKGYAALVCHRAAYRLWNRKKFTALFLQSQASAVFGLDIHPKARIGSSVMLDHGTGIVIGETAIVGDGCTLLHGVTLGGTGKDHGDRHPKVGNHVLIGAGASLLGNITIGDSAKIGAGSVVLRPIPTHATAVGAPAKIIGRAIEIDPAADVDELLNSVELFRKSASDATLSTTDSSTDISQMDLGKNSPNGNAYQLSQSSMCPYREYSRLAKSAPAGSITICVLYKLLKPYGCTMEQIGSCLFELDVNNVGYVSAQVLREKGTLVIQKYTSLDAQTANRIVESYFHGNEPNHHQPAPCELPEAS